MKNQSLLFSCLGLALLACGTEGRSSVSASASAGVATGSSPEGSAASSTATDPAAPAQPEPASTSPAEDFAGDLPLQPAATLEPEPIRWRACGHIRDRDISCAEVYVPLDHADPGGEQIAIALSRISANRAYPRRGVLLFNPGGPGVPGKLEVLGFIAEFDQVAPGFDIIGFDPRGIGESGDRACAPPLDELLPYGSKQARVTSSVELLDDVLAEAARCADAWGPTFNKLGSNQAVRDLDWIRQALGEPKLNFLGVSYGTRLGALYAHYFPETSGAIVLDAVVTPEVDWLQDARDTFNEQSRLTDIVLSGCEAGAIAGCPTDARQLFAQLVADARARGVLEAVMNEWIAGISSPDGVEVLVSFLQAQSVTDGEWLAQAPLDGETSLAGAMQLATVNCIDATAEPPTIEQLESLAAEFEATNPAFGDALLGATLCAGWSVVRDPVPVPTAPSAPTLLVIGGAYDWRTPYPNAVAMAEALGNARLLTSNHIGHGALLLGGACAQSAMRNFFVDGVLPLEGTVCDPTTPALEADTPERLPSSLRSSRPTLLAR